MGNRLTRAATPLVATPGLVDTVSTSSARSLRRAPGRRWHVTARVLAAVVLGYLVTNTVGVMLALASPASKPSAVAGATIASFLLWAVIAMWVFSVRRTRTAWVGLLGALVVSGAAAWLLIGAEASA